MQIIKAAAAAGIIKQPAAAADRKTLDKRPSVTARPENQYVAVARRRSFSLTPVDHMETSFISSPAHTNTQSEIS